MALAALMAGTAFEAGGLQFHVYAQALGAKYHARMALPAALHCARDCAKSCPPLQLS